MAKHVFEDPVGHVSKVGPRKNMVTPLPSELTLDEWFTKELRRRIKRYDGNITEIARSLGVTKNMIKARSDKLGFDLEAFRIAKVERERSEREAERKRKKKERKQQERKLKREIKLRRKKRKALKGWL